MQRQQKATAKAGVFALRPLLSPSGWGACKGEPTLSFAPLVQMYTFLASQGMADATSDARGARP